jgi:tRNA1Val (adenine37-N6)-methyltransferase
VSNNYFQFKQFKIKQEHCAMKVCTDACLFGAWVVEYLQQNKNTNPLRVLDIGTGTGLLSLMTAQEIECTIDAVEMESSATRQASENIADSSFHSKIKVHEADIKTWDSNTVYDCIISNPPFYENDLTSPDVKKNIALHSTSLSLKELIEIVDKKLKQQGVVAILLPYHRKVEMIQLALVRNLFLHAHADIKQTSKHSYFRTFLLFSRKKQTPLSEEIIIQDNRVYSDRFIQLLKKFYLTL